MADRLIQFGMGTNRFVFADHPKMYQMKLNPDRFDDMEFESTALPGQDGEFPSNPTSRGRTTSTQIVLKFRYAGVAETDFTAFSKTLNKMKNQGLSNLFKQMSDGTVVFTIATCLRAHVDPDNDTLAHIWPNGELIFKCPKARWYSKPDMAFFDNGLAFDSGLIAIGPQIDRITVDSGDIVQVTNNGDANAGLFMWFEAPAGETIENPSLSRISIDGVNYADSITYNDTLDGGNVVILDARNHQAQLNYEVFAASGYGAVEALRATWMEIPPGEHDLIVGGTFSNGMVLTLDLWDTYY